MAPTTRAGQLRRLMGDVVAVTRTVDAASAARWFGGLVAGAPQVVRTATLTPADRTVTRGPVRATVATGQVALLPAELFGSIRELYCRDVYLRRGLTVDPDAWVVDLGANRGLFTVMAAVQGARVLAVEAQPGFVADIERLARANRVQDRIQIETALVKANAGAIAPVGVLADAGAWRAATHVTDEPVVTTTMNELVDRHGIDRIGLLKVDIEGGEFGLLDPADDLAWLDLVDQITMEVHPEHGPPPALAGSLAERGFTWETTDDDGRPVPVTAPGVAYLYARRPGGRR